MINLQDLPAAASLFYARPVQAEKTRSCCVQGPARSFCRCCCRRSDSFPSLQSESAQKEKKRGCCKRKSCPAKNLQHFDTKIASVLALFARVQAQERDQSMDFKKKKMRGAPCDASGLSTSVKLPQRERDTGWGASLPGAFWRGYQVFLDSPPRCWCLTQAPRSEINSHQFWRQPGRCVKRAWRFQSGTESRSQCCDNVRSQTRLLLIKCNVGYGPSEEDNTHKDQCSKWHLLFQRAAREMVPGDKLEVTQPPCSTCHIGWI